MMFAIQLVILAGLSTGAVPLDAEEGAKPESVSKVTLLRVPDGGIQPQLAIDSKGHVHLIYFSGDPMGGDIFYVRSDDAGRTFSRRLRVNSQPGSAIAIGNIRGAHLAIGKHERVHVAWNGSGKAEPKGSGGASPMLYSRLNDAGDAFEPQRNLIHSAFGLDGGGSVAADHVGNVYVAWHAPRPGSQGEENRQVWITRSTDEGKSFAPEKAAFEERTGACGCCGLRVFAGNNGGVYLLYRAARDHRHRDMFLLTSTNHGTRFEGECVSQWDIASCPMTTAAFAEAVHGVLAAWESKGQVFNARIDSETGKRSRTIAAPGETPGRKYPAVACNSNGETILVWTEQMSWNRGGSVVWQVYDRDGSPRTERGRAAGVPTWSLVAVFVRPDGGFTVVY
ncbi:MAG TPA: sialidase family protein [Gemmataceae bacterium]|nr:sialidase family protein [Gemmataceae bacterium]